MPKYYCDYCDAFLTHDSPSVRKTHNSGRKHKENVRMYYQGWMEQQAQKLVDATARAFTQQRMLNPGGMPMMGVRGMMPPMRPPMGMPGMPGMPFPYPAPMMMPPMGMPGMAGMPSMPAAGGAMPMLPGSPMLPQSIPMPTMPRMPQQPPKVEP